MPVTYDFIAEQNLFDVQSVTFSNIPQTFTTLRLVMRARGNNGSFIYIRPNNNTNQVYAWSTMYNNGTSLQLLQQEPFSNLGMLTNMPGTNEMGNTFICDFWNYRGTTDSPPRYKGMLGRSGERRAGAAGINFIVNCAATIYTQPITSLVVFANINFNTGSSVALFGI